MPDTQRKYYQYVEKNSEDVSPLWKVFHASLFILLSINSFSMAFTFHDIADSFNSKCILYGTVAFRLDNINYTTTTSTATTTITNDIDTTNIIPPTTRTAGVTKMNLSEEEDIIVLPGNVSFQESNYNEKLKSYVIKVDNEYWVINSTLKSRVMVDHTQIVYGDYATCNAMLFFPLSTLVMTTFAAVMMIICGRGGKGKRSDIFPHPWSYVCPVITFSSIMLIISIAIAAVFHGGMKTYCSGFGVYTGYNVCTRNIQDFTDPWDRFGDDNLYTMYRICMATHYFAVVLWLLQLTLSVVRIVCITDFRLYIVTITCKRGLKEYHEVDTTLKKSYHGIRQKRISFALPESFDESTEDTTTTTTV